MADLLERAMAAVQNLSPEAQDEIARVVLMMATDKEAIYELTSQEKASFAESRDESRRGGYATEEQVRAVWAKHGL